MTNLEETSSNETRVMDDLRALFRPHGLDSVDAVVSNDKGHERRFGACGWEDDMVGPV